MSHLVAYFGNEPDNLNCALFSARNALHTQAPVEGWALGFVQGGDVLLQKRPRGNAAEVDFYALSRDLKADALIGRVGLGSDENRDVENADPFRFRSWLFGSIGVVPAFESVRAQALAATPDFLRRNIHGKSAGEHLFHLFLANLHQIGLLDTPSPDPTRVDGALRQAIHVVTDLLAQSGHPVNEGQGLELTAVATNSRCLVAVNNAHAMQYLAVDGIADCPVCHDRLPSHGDSRRISHEGLRAVVIEANPTTLGRAGWRKVPDRASLVVGSDRLPHITNT